MRSSAFWAKFRQDGAYHPLVAHSADVAAVMERLLQPDSLLASRLARAAQVDVLEPATRAALVYLTALHDLGKANHGFQDRRNPRESRNPRYRPGGHVGVVVESRNFEPLRLALADALATLNVDDPGELFLTVLFHHGRPGPGETLQPVDARDVLWRMDFVTGRDPIAEVRRLIGLARTWSGVPFSAPVPGEPAFLHLFAGILTLADWIGSTESAFPFEPDADADPAGYWDQAGRNADLACRRVGLVPATRVVTGRGPELLGTLFPELFGAGGHGHPTPLQAHAAGMDLPAPGARLIIESETGSGKTEAVLTLYARLRDAGRVGGLVFALPTRATSTAMFSRVARAMGGMYTSEDRPTIALAMGGEGVEATAEELLLKEDPRLYPDDADLPIRQWSSSNAKKFFAAEIVVGTVDQVLLSVLRVSHAHLRMAALARHLLVVDEVHSCDRYMLEVMGRLVDFHTRLGGMVVFMSATLSNAARDRLGLATQEEASFAEATELAFPTVLSATPGEANGRWLVHPLEEPEGGRTARSVEWTFEADEGPAIASAVRMAVKGARVCILRNTVKDARETLRTLRRTHPEALWASRVGGPAVAYHSRYALPDRAALDRAVLAAFSNRSSDGGGILVATQVVEQSLDVDFDFLLTDLCPVDVLLQRLGRLHRHRSRDDYRIEDAKTPRAVVLGPEAGMDAYLKGQKLRGPRGWGPVYRDGADLELTRRLVMAVSTIRIPRDNRFLIESVYHPDRRDELAAESEEWERHILAMEGTGFGEEVTAAGSCIDFSRGYADSSTVQDFELAAESRIYTRIGTDLVRVQLPVDVPLFHAGPHALPVRQVDAPDWVFRTKGAGLPVSQVEATECTVTENGIEFTVGEVGPFRYDVDGWHWPGSG